MFPFKTELKLDRKIKTPLYLQLSKQIIELIYHGSLPANMKLPSSRSLANSLDVHRKTIVNCYQELIDQGWVISIEAKGTFINNDLPIVKKHTLTLPKKRNSDSINFEFIKYSHLDRKPIKKDSSLITITDGIPDIRLAPLDEIAKIYRTIAQKEHHQDFFNYGATHGSILLREALVNYLNETRGLVVTTDQILITRGSQMGIYLSSKLLITQGENIIVGHTNYMTVDDTFITEKATIIRVPVDQNGLDTFAIEEICKKKNIRAVYVTSHHHHPTTVTLSAKRRMHLLALAKQYRFAIIEDDYDYDFHYENAPIVPLASHDLYGNVIYIGGFSKIISPGIRIGYVIAPSLFIHEAAKFRRIIDRQGDFVMEATIARMLLQRDIQRHTKKALRIYRKRRDLFCNLLTTMLPHAFDFVIPQGGMAIWVLLLTPYNWTSVTEQALSNDLQLGDWQRYDNNTSGHAGMRFGFANFEEDEIYDLIGRLIITFNQLDKKSTN